MVFDSWCSFVAAKYKFFFVYGTQSIHSCSVWNYCAHHFFVSDKINKSYLLKWEDVIRAAAWKELNYFYSIIKLSWNIPLPWKPFPHIQIILSYYDNVVILICTNQKYQFQGDLTHHSYYGFGFKFYANTRKHFGKK